MNLLPNEDQVLLRDAVRQWAKGRSPVSRARALRDSGEAWSKKVWRELAELGVLGVQIPEAQGGGGLGFFELCLALEVCGSKLAPEPLVSTLLLGTQALLLGDDPGGWLGKVAAGEAVLGVEGAGALVGGQLTGTWTDVLDAQHADRLLLACDDGLLLVDPVHAQLSARERLDSRAVAEVRLEGARVEAKVGGPELLGRVLDRAAIGLSAEMLGAAEQLFRDTVAYLQTREQFGHPIGRFQALQHRAARLFVELTQARPAVVAAAKAVDEDEARVPRLASLAKATISEVAMRVAYEAVQMHGGIGMTDECDVGLYLKRLHTCAVSFGDAAWHRRRWATLGGY